MNDHGRQRVNQILRLLDRLERQIEGGEVEPIEGRAELRRVLLATGALIHQCDRRYRGPARSGIEAQHAYNDVFPGDPCPPHGWYA